MRRAALGAGRVFIVAVLGLALAGSLGRGSQARAGTDVIADYPIKAAEFPCSAGNVSSVVGDVYTDSNRNTIASKLGVGGAQWVRVPLQWSLAETALNSWGANYLTRLDQCMQKIVTTNHMKVLFDVISTPLWTEYNTPANLRKPYYPSDDCLTSNPNTCAYIKGFMTHMTDLFLPYGASNFAFEIWNEPNTLSHWTTQDLLQRDERYFYMLRAAYGAVKVESPDVVVMNGGPTSLGGGGGGDTWINWITELYNDACSINGCTRPWDVVALHPYPNYDNGSCPLPSTVFSPVGTSILNTMSSHGDGAKEIWFTEFGWSSGYNYTGVSTENRALCSQTLQNARLTSSYTYSYIPSNVQVMFWFTSDRKYLDSVVNSDTGAKGCFGGVPEDWDCGTELLTASLAERGLYTTFKNAPQSP